MKECELIKGGLSHFWAPCCNIIIKIIIIFKKKKNTNSGDKHIQLTNFYKLDVLFANQHTFSKVPLQF